MKTKKIGLVGIYFPGAYDALHENVPEGFELVDALSPEAYGNLADCEYLISRLDICLLYTSNVLDLPVVYRNNSYYLTHDFNKNKSTAGTIFLDENHPMTERTQNLLLHGHNMKDGTMFGRLAQYEKNLEYLKAHAFIDFSTLWHQERYVVFAVLDVSLDIGDDRFVEYFAHPTFKSCLLYTS